VPGNCRLEDLPVDLLRAIVAVSILVTGIFPGINLRAGRALPPLETGYGTYYEESEQNGKEEKSRYTRTREDLRRHSIGSRERSRAWKSRSSTRNTTGTNGSMRSQMTKRTYITVRVLVAFLFSLAAEGRRESPYPTLREDDWIKISSDAPGIVIERHGTDETMHVELTGRGSERYRLTVLRERDGVSVEVKKKQRIGVFLSDFFDAGLYISIPESWTEGEIEVETVSGAIRVEEFIEARDIGFGTVSGAITFTGLRADEEVEIESVSGAIRGSNVIASSLELSSVSGAIMIDRIEVFNGKEDLQVESVSERSSSARPRRETPMSEASRVRSTSPSRPAMRERYEPPRSAVRSARTLPPTIPHGPRRGPKGSR
jgi:hypothetical protein